MKNLSILEMSMIVGGAGGSDDCMREVQRMANTHQNSGDPKAENDFWEEWLQAWDDCVGNY